nr:putative integron gene cassette protein [uncultured bacterium]CAP48723.1 putative integron gene cassette protein [uncultured bacterium]CAP48962.1 putative integron gene cassette protein [uncultured bacterium]CAP49108.1 putative integron gene cassette protein [uncultured bacterium]
MRLLRSAGLPEHFDGTDGYSVEIEEDPNVIYEAFVFTTTLDFDTALRQLESFLAEQYCPPQRTDKATSSVLVCSIGPQTVAAQITDFGDHRGGYIQSKAEWSWSIT